MRPKTLLVVVALAVALMFSAPKTFAQNLVSNGSFETDDFSGWTTGGNFEDTEVVTGAFYVPTLAPRTACSMPRWVRSEAMERSARPFPDIAGDHYNFSFWFNACW